MVLLPMHSPRAAWHDQFSQIGFANDDTFCGHVVLVHAFTGLQHVNTHLARLA